MGELVLKDAAGEFLLVHGNSEFLSLARRPDQRGEVPLVRFAPEHAALLAASMEAVVAEPDHGPLVVKAGADDLTVDLIERPGGRRLHVANHARRRPGTSDPEALELDRTVVASAIEALRGPRLEPLASPPRSLVFEDTRGRAAAVEAHAGVTMVSSRTERVWARARFASGLRRVVAACLAMVVGNPGETAIRMAHVSRGADAVLLERVATAAGSFPYLVANSRPGRPALPRRAVRLNEEMVTFVVRSLARDHHAPQLTNAGA